MQVLFSTGSPARYMLPPSLSDEQVVCGPDWADDCAPDGRVRSFATPAGSYDLALLAATKLPLAQQPDVVVCLVDASWRNLPRNLAAFNCPKVLLIADTHHLESPLIGMLRYLAAETFDRVVMLYDRHHAGIFQSAGIENLYWFPGLTFPHSDATVRAARAATRAPQIAFAGQTGGLHPRRTRLLGALAGRRLPVVAQPLPQREALGLYGSSLLGFNASLNGDLNLRVFEILAAGGALLTDRLAPESGLEQLLRDGVDVALYRDSTELTALAERHLAHPAAARALGEAGARWFDNHFSEAHRRTAFHNLAFNGQPAPGCEWREGGRPRTYFAGDTDRLLQSVIVYEAVQELHRTQESVRIVIDAAAGAEDFGALCTTLPRVQLGAPADNGAADLMVLGRGQAASVSGARAARLWCFDAKPDDIDALAVRFRTHGFVVADREAGIFSRADNAPAAPVVTDLAPARLLLKQGNLAGALALARTALENDPRSAGARVLLGELALLRDGAPLAETLFRQALELRPNDATIASLLADALRAQGKFSTADDLLARVLKAQPKLLPALFALARLRTAEQQADAAEAALRTAVRHHPRVPEAAQALGDFLKRAGRVREALEFHRRALGCTDTVAPLDPSRRAVRVAFIVQHPQGWTSLESVWRALQGDAAFVPTIIAAPYQHPYPTEGGPEAIYGFLAKSGIPFVKWNEFPLKKGFADIVFLQNPYDVTRPEPLHLTNILKLVPRVAYVPYGLEIGGGERNNTMVMNLPLQQLAWLVCARSERQRLAYAQHCATGNAHVAVTGHAKLDALRDLAEVRAPELEQFAAGRKLVGWNPHFDLRPNGTRFGEGFSTFTGWWQVIVREFARRHDQLALVLRPHPLLFGTLTARGIWSQAEVDAFHREVAAAGNILLDRGASYLGLFAQSTAMLSDASSFVLEYAATGKPLLYLHNPSGPALNDDGEFVREHLYTAQEDADITRFLDMVIAGDDPRSAGRRAAFPEFMYQPPEGAGFAVRQAILDRLAEERPARAQSNRSLEPIAT